MANYGTIEDADTYFETRLNVNPWLDASDADRLSALVMATQHIDRLAFIGTKLVETQDLQFPRYRDDTEETIAIPEEVEVACYEEALAILEGRDIEKESDSLMLQHTSLGKISFDLNHSFVPAHITNGIASSLAWQYLRPFLRDPRTITLSRVS